MVQFSIRVTDFLVAMTFLLAVMDTLGVLHPFQLFFSRALIIEEGQYWRLLTSIFYSGGLRFNVLAQLYWLHQLSTIVEQRYFHGRAFDYLFFLLLGCGMILLSRFFSLVDGPFLNDILDSLIVYLGSRVLPNTQITLFLLIDVRLRYLPLLHGFALAAFGGWESAKGELIGSFIGHVLWYFLEVFPRITGLNPMRIPL